MGHIIQTKQESRASGGPQYYLHGLEPQTRMFLGDVGKCEVWLGTPYGIVMSGLTAVAKDKVFKDGALRDGKVGHHRLQRQKAQYSVENEIKKWFRLDTAREIYRIEFRERTYHSKITGEDALLILPEKVHFKGTGSRKLRLDVQPLTFTKYHRSPLFTEHLNVLRKKVESSVRWSALQIGRILDDHLTKKVPYVGEEDILRVSGALANLGIQLDAYRKKGYDCFNSEIQFLDYPTYTCAIEVKKRSSGFDYQILKKTKPERAVVLCLQHNVSFVPQEIVDVIELEALHQHLSV